MKKLEPITPGEILLEEFLKPMGISQYRLAKEIDVPAQRISEIVLGKRSITADTDLRLCRFLVCPMGIGYVLKLPTIRKSPSKRLVQYLIRSNLGLNIRPNNSINSGW